MPSRVERQPTIGYAGRELCLTDGVAYQTDEGLLRASLIVSA